MWKTYTANTKIESNKTPIKEAETIAIHDLRAGDSRSSAVSFCGTYIGT
jgi:hypothetical protein